jgi:hypothetical protein
MSKSEEGPGLIRASNILRMTFGAEAQTFLQKKGIRLVVCLATQLQYKCRANLLAKLGPSDVAGIPDISLSPLAS